MGSMPEAGFDEAVELSSAEAGIIESAARQKKLNGIEERWCRIRCVFMVVGLVLENDFEKSLQQFAERNHRERKGQDRDKRYNSQAHQGTRTKWSDFHPFDDLEAVA